MVKVHHLNCLEIQSPAGRAIGHCLLLEANNKLVLVDTGIGWLDTQKPTERIGQALIDQVGFQFDESWTALRQIEQLGLVPEQVSDCVISHLDPDHIGGLADFPQATVHVGEEEYENFKSGHPRYLPHQLAHQPVVKTYSASTETWQGFESRKIDIDFEVDLYFVPLFGHTLGHCGVAIQLPDQWLFYVGDAYYLQAELTDPHHPVHELAKARADNDTWRLENLHKIKQLKAEQPNIEIFGYHDVEEYDRFAVKDD
ncbi:MAG: MBL fold metallo-hydrolase [Thermonemataceae bacterium]